MPHLRPISKQLISNGRCGLDNPGRLLQVKWQGRYNTAKSAKSGHLQKYSELLALSWALKIFQLSRHLRGNIKDHYAKIFYLGDLRGPLKGPGEGRTPSRSIRDRCWGQKEPRPRWPSLEGSWGHNLVGPACFWNEFDLSFHLIPVLLRWNQYPPKWEYGLEVFKYR